MERILGVGNDLGSYALVLAVYAALFVVIRQFRGDAPLSTSDTLIPPALRKTFMALGIAYALIGFVSNYLLYRLGAMSFLPWLDNVIHTFIWLGLCVSFLYISAYRRPLWEQFVLFTIFSFVVKLAERQILGTWEMDHFFVVPGNIAYMLGWSLVDGFIPIGSMIGLRVVSRFISGLVVPAGPVSAPPTAETSHGMR